MYECYKSDATYGLGNGVRSLTVYRETRELQPENGYGDYEKNGIKDLGAGEVWLDHGSPWHRARRVEGVDDARWTPLRLDDDAHASGDFRGGEALYEETRFTFGPTEVSVVTPDRFETYERDLQYQASSLGMGEEARAMGMKLRRIR